MVLGCKTKEITDHNLCWLISANTGNPKGNIVLYLTSLIVGSFVLAAFGITPGMYFNVAFHDL